MTLNSDLLDRLGIRVGFGPWDERRSGAASWAPLGGTWGNGNWGSTLGFGLATGGYGVLQFNPQLTVQWSFYQSPYGGFGPSKNLATALDNRGIEILKNKIVPPGAVRGASSNAIGAAGENAARGDLKAQGYRDVTPGKGINAADSRVPDVIGQKSGFWGGEIKQVEAEKICRAPNFTPVLEI
ncbi:MAG: hypothetical protein IOC54_11805 [Methylobacterium sp.]|nr:hypothetical protein [Methylobacterium sp.]MCA3652509.1 hypothetical protein [Methylobacterium sp.]MCA4921397.1 hypothetical protein [Methylobacterium sp.]